MHTPQLDDRLSRAAALFPACAYGADIGADHGRLSCALLARGTCERMCVSDISADSLQKARQLLEKQGLKGRADFCIGDGLTVLPRAADAVAVLGMGGHTVCRILRQGADRLQGAALVLSAHTQMEALRRTLMELLYRIDKEEIAYAAGRHYVVLKAVCGTEKLDERQCYLGPRLMEGCAAHYPAYIRWRIRRAEQERSDEGKQHLLWLKEEEARVGIGTGYR